MRLLHELPHLVGEDARRLVPRDVHHELLERPDRLLEQRAELAVDLADEEAELVEALLYLAAPPRRPCPRPSGCDRCVVRHRDSVDSTTIGAVTATVVVGANVDSVDVAVVGVTATATETAGDTGDDDGADHRDGGECRERIGRRGGMRGEEFEGFTAPALPAGQA